MDIVSRRYMRIALSSINQGTSANYNTCEKTVIALLLF